MQKTMMLEKFLAERNNHQKGTPKNGDLDLSKLNSLHDVESMVGTGRCSMHNKKATDNLGGNSGRTK